MKSLLILFLGVIIGSQSLAQENSAPYNLEIIELINQHPDSLGCDTTWTGSGVTEAIYFKGKQVLWASKNTYCVGVTFDVVMKIAKKHQLLKTKSFSQIRKFQQEWYCVAESKGKEKGCVTALINLGIGEEVSWENAKTGDFIQFWRKGPKLSGHSAIFKEWVIEDEKIVGVLFRSSQKSTNGVGDKTEYFDRVLIEGKQPMDPERLYIGRLY